MNVNSSSNRGEAILAALKTQFPGAVLDEERQTPEQVTITVKINLLPDVVHYLYYQHDGWLPVLFGRTSGDRMDAFFNFSYSAFKSSLYT